MTSIVDKNLCFRCVKVDCQGWRQFDPMIGPTIYCPKFKSESFCENYWPIILLGIATLIVGLGFLAISYLN